LPPETTSPPRQTPTAHGQTTARSWRERVLGRTLTAAAVVVPPIVLLALFVRPVSSTRLDMVLLGTLGFLLPILRLVPRPSLSARGAIGLAAGFGIALYNLSRVGLSATVNVTIVAICLMAVVFVGRWAGYLVVTIAALATLVVGLLVTQGKLALAAIEVDPARLKNWLRVALTNALLGTLVVSVIDFVIRQLEASSLATRAALDEARTAYGQLGLLHRRLEAAKEEERRFIAHELHDELGQNLTALKLRIALAQRGAGPRPDQDESREALALIDQLIERVRKMSGDLRPPLLDEVGLVPALRAFLARQSALTGVSIELVVTEAEHLARLSPELEIACFRVIQESLTNALRHGAARKVTVTVRRDDASVALVIRDDGAGFDAAAKLAGAAARGHLGVVGMRERVRVCGGTFRLASSPAAGTTVEAVLPAALA
jgi:signal transduction histidine kinase